MRFVPGAGEMNSARRFRRSSSVVYVEAAARLGPRTGAVPMKVPSRALTTAAASAAKGSSCRPASSYWPCRVTCGAIRVSLRLEGRGDHHGQQDQSRQGQAWRARRQAKAHVGKAIGNEQMQAEGKALELKGKASQQIAKAGERATRQRVNK